MRYIVAEVEWYAHGRTYELQNVGTGASYGLGLTKILYCYHLYRFDRFYLDQFVAVLFSLRRRSSLPFHLRLTGSSYVSLYLYFCPFFAIDTVETKLLILTVKYSFFSII